MERTVQLSIPLDVLLSAIRTLALPDKYRLLEILEKSIAEVEEELWEREPQTQALIQEARSAYHTGDFVSLKSYIQSKQAEK
jgi:hypothetical protein